MSQAIIVGYDGSAGAQRALDYAIAIASAGGGKLILATAIDRPVFGVQDAQHLALVEEETARDGERLRETLLDPLAARLRLSGLTVEVQLAVGSPAETIAELATTVGASQIVVGRRGASRLRALLFGSVSAALAQTAPVPVTVVP